MRTITLHTLGMAGLTCALWVWCLVGATLAPAGSLWRAIGMAVVTLVLG